MPNPASDASDALAALAQPSRLECVDGLPDTPFVSKAGELCVYVNNASLYFKAGDSDDVGDADGPGWSDSATALNLKIAIHYFDKGTETIRIGYTTNGTTQTNTTIVTKENTKRWRKATLILTDALFGTSYYGIDEDEVVGGGGDHFNADFRIFSSGDLYLASIAVTNRDTKAAVRFPAYDFVNQTNIVPPESLSSSGDEFPDNILAGWLISAAQFSSANGDAILNAATPFLSLGNLTGFSDATAGHAGAWLGKDGGIYKQVIGSRNLNQYMSYDGSQLYVSGTIAGTIVSGGTDSNTWTINQDLTAGVNVDLVFGRGGGNATIRWNGTVVNVLNTLQENGVTVTKQNRTITAGNGLSGGGDLSADRTISLQTPGTLTVATSNSAAGNHTHALTSSSNPGAAAALLASDASGFLTLVKLKTDTLADKSGGNLTIAPAGDIVLNPTGNDILPTNNYDLNLGALSKKYLTLHAAELWVETLVAQNTLATIGGRILILPTNILIADVGTGDTTLDVKYNNLNSGDRIYLEANGAVEFMAVTSGASVIGGGYRYSVTRNLDGSGANQWYAGDAIANTGQTGDGWIDAYSVRGVKASSEAGPTIAGNIRNSSTYNDWSTMWAIGNLNGLYGYGADTPGAAFGKYASGNPNITVDTTNGIRIRNYTTTIGQWDTSGNITVGEVGASKSNVYITSNKVQLRTNTTVHIELDTAGKIIVGEVGASKSNVYITSNKVQLRTNTTVHVELDTAGKIIVGETANSKARTEISAGQFDVIRRDASAADKTKFRVKADGTILVGTDVTAAATTNFVVFTGNQTYNSESVEDGDILFGDNTTGGSAKANILWDKSAGQLKFRGGTTTKIYIDATGALKAGGGNFTLDDNGLSIAVGGSVAITNKLRYLYSGTEIGYLSGYNTGGLTDTLILQTSDTSRDLDKWIRIDAITSTTKEAHVLLSAGLINFDRLEVELHRTNDDDGNVFIRRGGLCLEAVGYAPSAGTKNNVSTKGTSHLDANPAGNITITGFANGQDGKLLFFSNKSNFDVTFNHQDTGSVAANRISSGNAANRTITGTGYALFIYSANRWRLISIE